jgi:hypothetical protein
MPHIIILDEFGNEIGRAPHGPEDPDGGGGGGRVAEEPEQRISIPFWENLAARMFGTQDNKKGGGSVS